MSWSSWQKQYPLLSTLSPKDICVRFVLLRHFNVLVQEHLPHIDYYRPPVICAKQPGSLANELSVLKGLIFMDFKLDLLRKQLGKTATPPRKNSYNELEWDTITIDRQAAKKLKKGGAEEEEWEGPADSLFHQAVRELNNIPTVYLRQQTEDILDKDQTRTFKVKFVGEAGTDNGGPYRELFNDIIEELESGIVPLFIPCPNAAIGGESLANQSSFLLNPAGALPARLPLYVALGKLIGVAIRTKVPLNLHFPPLVWKHLVSATVTARDVEEFDRGFAQLRQLGEMSEQVDTDTFSAVLANLGVSSFTHRLSGGEKEVELVPAGRQRRVTAANCSSWLALAIKIRLNECTPMIKAILNGIGSVIPRPGSLFSLMAWQELELLVCGDVDFKVESLQKIAVYEGGFEPFSPQVLFLWDTLRMFDANQRSRFLRFVWARTRLPNSSVVEAEKFTIAQLPHDDWSDDRLPTASTCFFKLSLPLYSSREVLQRKLEYAMDNCNEMDLA